MELIQKYFTGFSEKQINQFAALKDLYTDWNAKINVISRKDMDNFYEHHVLHSLAIAAKFEFTKGMKVMDLGCGGGFPGIPLAIMFPETKFHMVDSINKKLKVVTEVAAAIGLQNLTTQHAQGRGYQDWPQDPAGKFDVVISRAVAPLKDLWHWSKPLIQKRKNDNPEIPNGLICLKGGDLTIEIFESGCKPMVWEIEKIFPQAYFRDKYILYIPTR
ncbi:MAG: 16S rRNA (guanine(527)-N(7))-methyltransferase RsmG [Chitinophagaceae bacterium]|nr:16S rRNA (guanine(527)-N(7))-methyltransferase RsmG [Chitinophagaceae bacterium]